MTIYFKPRDGVFGFTLYVCQWRNCSELFLRNWSELFFFLGGGDPYLNVCI